MRKTETWFRSCFRNIPTKLLNLPSAQHYSSADLFGSYDDSPKPLSFLSALDAENELLVQEALERLMEGKSFHLCLSNCIHLWRLVGFVLLLRFLVCPVFLFPALLNPINRENSRGHRSPSIHHPECECRRRTGPAACSGVRPAHRAARQQARTVPKTDGETGVSTRRAETSASLRGQEVQTIGWRRERNQAVRSVAGKTTGCAPDKGWGQRNKIYCLEWVELDKSWNKVELFTGL